MVNFYYWWKSRRSLKIQKPTWNQECCRLYYIYHDYCLLFQFLYISVLMFCGYKHLIHFISWLLNWSRACAYSAPTTAMWPSSAKPGTPSICVCRRLHLSAIWAAGHRYFVPIQKEFRQEFNKLITEPRSLSLSGSAHPYVGKESKRNRANHPTNTQRSSFSPATLLALNVTNLWFGIPIKSQIRVFANNQPCFYRQSDFNHRGRNSTKAATHSSSIQTPNLSVTLKWGHISSITENYRSRLGF